MATLQGALFALVATFDKYASKDGDNKSLTKAEAKELLQSELGLRLGNASDQAAADSIFNKLDLNEDETVNFREFLNLFASLAADLHMLQGIQASPLGPH